MDELNFTPLQRNYPKIFRTFVDHFQSRGIQSYDFIAEVCASADKSMLLRIRYGENFEELSTLEVSDANLTDLSDEVLQFVSATADLCHAGLISDYKVFMKVQV